MLDSKAQDRFWSKVDKSGDCWLWTGTRSEKGYGEFFVGNRRKMRATRVMLELTGRPRPENTEACHTCDNPSCVRPEHLWWGTRRENMLDMVAKGRCWLVEKTHCPNGHPMDSRDRRSRYCSICRKDSWARSVAKAREKRIAEREQVAL